MQASELPKEIPQFYPSLDEVYQHSFVAFCEGRDIPVAPYDRWLKLRDRVPAMIDGKPVTFY